MTIPPDDVDTIACATILDRARALGLTLAPLTATDAMVRAAIDRPDDSSGEMFYAGIWAAMVKAAGDGE